MNRAKSYEICCFDTGHTKLRCPFCTLCVFDDKVYFPLTKIRNLSLMINFGSLVLVGNYSLVLYNIQPPRNRKMDTTAMKVGLPRQQAWPKTATTMNHWRLKRLMEVRYPDIKMLQFVSGVKGFQIYINENPNVSKLYFELIKNSKDEFKDEFKVSWLDNRGNQQIRGGEVFCRLNIKNVLISLLLGISTR